MTDEQFAILVTKLDGIIYCLESLNGFILFIIGCTAAIIVLLILYNFLFKCISKF